MDHIVHIHLESFCDELEKIAANVIMKEMTPAAKAFMNKMTGFGRRAKRLPTALHKQQQKLKKDLAGIPIITDPDMSHLPTRRAVRDGQEKLDNMLRRTGRSVESSKRKAKRLRASRPTVAATPISKRKELAA